MQTGNLMRVLPAACLVAALSVGCTTRSSYPSPAPKVTLPSATSTTSAPVSTAQDYPQICVEAQGIRL